MLLVTAMSEMYMFFDENKQAAQEKDENDNANMRLLKMVLSREVSHDYIAT